MGQSHESVAIDVRLATAPPFAGDLAVSYLGAREVAGVEYVDPGGAYHRTLNLSGGPGIVSMTPSGEGVSVRLVLSDRGDLTSALDRCHRLFDLGADSVAIDAHLGDHPPLGDLVRARPGLRSPGAVDGAEMLVRAIVGQQVSVAGARTVLGVLAERHGEDLPAAIAAHWPGPSRPRTFPRPARLAELNPQDLPMPRARGRALVSAMGEVSKGGLRLDPGDDPTEAAERMQTIAGIGPWTASYVALRAFGDADVFLASDLAVRRSLAKLEQPASGPEVVTLAQRWSPWRSYALHHLWLAS